MAAGQLTSGLVTGGVPTLLVPVEVGVAVVVVVVPVPVVVAPVADGVAVVPPVPPEDDGAPPLPDDPVVEAETASEVVFVAPAWTLSPWYVAPIVWEPAAVGV